MKVLAYSPSVEVYAAVKTKGGEKYYDLSDDVVQCSVSLKSDSASEFSIRLQNVNSKYNGLFLPFDRITILTTKNKRVRLITGYVTKAPKFTLYNSDITIEGACPIYRLQQLYWDPNLTPSLELMGWNGKEKSWDAVLFNLLTKVGGYNSSQVQIGEQPPDALNYAKEMYLRGQDYSNQIKERVDEFYEILRTHGPQLGGGGGSVIQGVSEDQNKIVEVAKNWQKHGISATGGYCAKWVSDVWQKAGFTRPGGNAIDFWNSWKGTGSDDISTAPLAAVLVGSGSGSAGATYGHVGIKTGDDEVMSCVGDGANGVRTESVSSFYSWQTATCQGHTGKIGWVIPPGPVFGSSGSGGAYKGIDMSLSESAFIKKWGPRIDKWIASNHPKGALSGHGNQIAKSGRAHNVDPRMIVAIAAGESGCGEVSTSSGSHGRHNYWSWGIGGMAAGIWAGTVDAAIEEFATKFGKQYAGKTPEQCADAGYGEKDYIMAHWQPVIDAI